jgi:hypothetical protein
MTRGTSRSIALACTLASLWIAACSGGGGNVGSTPATDGGPDKDAPNVVDGNLRADAGDASSEVPDAPANGLALTCFATTAVPAPNPCPAPSGTSGMASFCYRPQWAGVTVVDVYGGFGQATDWTAPFLALTNDGSGTFTGTAPLANGTYPYIFETEGSDDNLVSDHHVFLDQYNTSFVPSPPAAPHQRSVSSLTVPQGAAASIVHIKGAVLFEGQPQPCYSIDLEAGENDVDNRVVSEHDTANFTESAPDGTFDFPVAVGAPYMVVVRYPFLLSAADAGYPNQAATPSVAIARTTVTVTADLTLDSVDITYPLADYAAMSPTGGTATLPVTFAFTVIAGAADAYVSVTSSNVAGDDPAYASTPGASTSVVWDGTFNGEAGAKAVLGTTYYWGSWQDRAPLEDGGTKWVEESLIFPLTFH